MFIPNLQDPIRNYSYERFLNIFHDMKGLKESMSVLDVGTRDSKFPAFLNTIRRYWPVVAIDREDYSKVQESISEAYACASFSFQQRDLLTIMDRFDIVTAVYALQHNIEKDIACYKRCADIIKKNEGGHDEGYIYITNEFNHTETKLQMGRDDGDMRIYSSKDVEDRIIKPIESVSKIKDLKIFYDKFVFENQSVSLSDKENANSITLLFKL